MSIEGLPGFDAGSDFEEREHPRVYYHGSKVKLRKIKHHKATAPEGRPADEDLDAIYLTLDFVSALAFAARPDGITHIDHDASTIHFQHPEAFDPEREVYIYEVDASGIPEAQVRAVKKEDGEDDERQVIVTGVKSIRPLRAIKMRAGDITKYYKII
jgi:hypothetical protein